MINIYKGSTFQVAGSLQQDGKEADFTGWTLTANLYDSTGTILISQIDVNWIDIKKGIITLSSPSTSTWVLGKARIDVKLVTPLNEIILGPPTYVRILQSPLG